MSSNTLKLSFRTSLIVTLTTSFLFLLTDIALSGTIHILIFFLFLCAQFIISFLVFRYTLDKFIYQRIRLIYKTIHSSKINRNQKEQLMRKIETSEDLIGDVNTEVLSWAETRKEEAEQFTKLEQYRKEFLGNVLHELKTPVFTIQGYVHTLLDGAMDDPEVSRKYLQRTDTNIDRLNTIITDLDVIAGLETGEMILDYKNFNLSTLCREVFEALEIKSQKKNVKLFLSESSERHISVVGDRERIRQVLTNLLVNSIHYGIESGRTKVSIFDMDENVLVEVSDNGIGIDEEHLPRIFERFYRVDKSRSRDQGGTGLGLAIVKHIVEAHKQSVHVRSTPGKGTTFSFTLKKA
ncbi:MAG: ATP-binding protein [Bacteroidota bacterium]